MFTLCTVARVADTPQEVAAVSDIVFSIVGFPSDVREAILGKEGVLKGLRAGGILVDMTTSEPSLAGEIAAAAASQGKYALDAPVSGGDIGAREAKLSIMIGGDRSVVTAVDPLFRLMVRVSTLQASLTVVSFLLSTSNTRARIFAIWEGPALDNTRR